MSEPTKGWLERAVAAILPPGTGAAVILLRGVSGAGKSTLARALAAAMPPGAVRIVSSDNYFVWLGGGTYAFDPSRLGEAHAQCLQDFRLALEEDTPVIIVDNTNTSRRDYAPYDEAAREHRGPPRRSVVIAELKCPDEDTLAACGARNAHGVPLTTLRRQWDRLRADPDPRAVLLPPWLPPPPRRGGAGAGGGGGKSSWSIPPAPAVSPWGRGGAAAAAAPSPGPGRAEAAECFASQWPRGPAAPGSQWAPPPWQGRTDPPRMSSGAQRGEPPPLPPPAGHHFRGSDSPRLTPFPGRQPDAERRPASGPGAPYVADPSAYLSSTVLFVGLFITRACRGELATRYPPRFEYAHGDHVTVVHAPLSPGTLTPQLLALVGTRVRLAIGRECCDACVQAVPVSWAEAGEGAPGAADPGDDAQDERGEASGGRPHEAGHGGGGSGPGRPHSAPSHHNATVARALAHLDSVPGRGLSSNVVAHVTLSVAPGVLPSEANAMLERAVRRRPSLCRPPTPSTLVVTAVLGLCARSPGGGPRAFLLDQARLRDFVLGASGRARHA